MSSADPLQCAALTFHALRDRHVWNRLVLGTSPTGGAIGRRRLRRLDQAFAGIADLVRDGLAGTGAGDMNEADILSSPTLDEWRRQEVAAANAVLAFLDAGRQIFQFDAELTDALRQTDFGPLTTDDIRLPFEALVLRPDGGIGIAGTNADCIVASRHPDGVGVLLQPLERPWPSPRLLGVYHVHGGTTLDHAADDAALEAVVTGSLDERHLDDAKHMVAACISMLLYLCAVPDVVEEIGGQDMPENRGIGQERGEAPSGNADGSLRLRTLDIGVIHLRRHGLGDDETGAMTRAHMRRGHWRRQRHGTGGGLMTLRWIRPTRVGGRTQDIRVNRTRSRP